MHILYKITYLPHSDTEYPKYYIGSKYNYKGDYYGSVASTQVFGYTDGLELRQWWKRELNNKNNFIFEILDQFENISTLELVEREYDLHISLNVLASEYFNQSIATKGYVSIKNSEETKRKKSEKTKKYWDSEEGKLKKERLSERNRLTKSDEMKEKWKSPSPSMLNAIKNIKGRQRGCKDKTPRKKKTARKVYAEGMVFIDAYEAAIYFNIHVVNIRRRCRVNYNEWRYLDESLPNN